MMTMEINVKYGPGSVALVDDADVSLVLQYKWFFARSRPNATAYATTDYRKDRKRIKIRMHNLIMRPAPGQFVDHINRNGLDNRRCNLRIASPSENAINRSTGKIGKSEFRGVVISKYGKFCATIGANGRRHYLGSYDSEMLAARAYDAAAVKLFGDFATLNFMGWDAE